MDPYQEGAKLLRRLAELMEQLALSGTPIDVEPQGATQAAVNAMTNSRPKTKWVTFRLELAQPIGKPKAQRIIDRVCINSQAHRQLVIQMGQGTASRQAVVAFMLKVTDHNGDGHESADFMAGKLNERGSDLRARAKVSSVVRVD